MVFTILKVNFQGPNDFSEKTIFFVYSKYLILEGFYLQFDSSKVFNFLLL